LDDQFRCDLEAQAGLADATRSSQGDQAHVHATQQRSDGGDLVLAAEQRGGLRRQVGAVRVERVQRRKGCRQIGGDELEDLLGQAEVFQAVRAEVAQRRVGRQVLAYQLLTR
jgi:hypothetical protein